MHPIKLEVVSYRRHSVDLFYIPLNHMTVHKVVCSTSDVTERIDLVFSVHHNEEEVRTSCYFRVRTGLSSSSLISVEKSYCLDSSSVTS